MTNVSIQPGRRRPLPGVACGFTLIELLVVIAIIAILLATSLPMVPAVNDEARVSTCEARLAQIGVALRLYAEDYQEYPRGLADLYTGRYMEQESILRCDRQAQTYFYRKLPLAAGRDEVLAACCDPVTAAGSRPHRHHTLSVQLLVHGGVRRAR